MKPLTLLLLASALTTAAQKPTMPILGTPFEIDTIAHCKVGPGTTRTHLSLKSTASSSQVLQVHYLTIDKSTPGVSLHAVSGTDKLAGTERPSNMAKRKSSPNRLYFAGCNGDFYATSGTATNGTTKVGTPTTSCTVDGEVYKTSNSNYQFTVDNTGAAHIGRLNYYTGTASIGDKTTLLKGINVMSPNNGITIYTPRFWGSSNQVDYAGNCAEVTAKLLEGDQMVCGEKFRLIVTSEPTSDGDTKIPADGVVIFGRGTSTTGCNTGAKAFVEALRPGDIVEMDHIVLLDNQRIYPRQIVSGNPKTVGEGLTLDSESERNDAKDRHPRTGIGISQDGNTIIMMVVEGRMNGSVGVRTSELAEIMRYAGAYEAVNLDGGGSSTLYTAALGVLNRCSDGSERPVGNAIFAAIDTDPDDKQITEVRFAAWAPKLPRYGRFTPRLLGFNSRGVMVNDSITTYTLECPDELGRISPDGHTLLADGTGCHALKAVVDGVEASVAVTIDGSFSYAPRIPNLLIDSYRQYTAEVVADNSINRLPISPEAFEWTSSDSSVASVEPDGTITGHTDGHATITGSVNNSEITINVTVEIPKAQRVNILAPYIADNWKFTSAGCNASATTSAPAAGGNGVDMAYTISSTRSLSLTITPLEALYFHSLPHSIGYTIYAGTTPLKKIAVNLADALGNRVAATSPEIPAGQTISGEIDLSEVIDIDDLASYPIKLTSISLSPDGAAGDSGTIELEEISAIYHDKAVDSVAEPQRAPQADEATRYFNLQGIPVAHPAPGQLLISVGATASKIIY